MIYKFKSKATGDLIMLGPDGDRMLRLIGREPAPKGIIEAVDAAAAIAALEAAVAADEGRRADARDDEDDAPPDARRVSLRQRVWPMVEMLRRAQSANQAVVWGV